KSTSGRVQCLIAPGCTRSYHRDDRTAPGRPPLHLVDFGLLMLRCRRPGKGCSAALPPRAPKGPPQPPHDRFLALALPQQELSGAVASVGASGFNEQRVAGERRSEGRRGGKGA